MELLEFYKVKIRKDTELIGLIVNTATMLSKVLEIRKHYNSQLRLRTVEALQIPTAPVQLK